MEHLIKEFIDGLESGKHPNSENDRKAIKAITSRLTSARVRAYWSGYLCAAQGEKTLLDFGK